MNPINPEKEKLIPGMQADDKFHEDEGIKDIQAIQYQRKSAPIPKEKRIAQVSQKFDKEFFGPSTDPQISQIPSQNSTQVPKREQNRQKQNSLLTPQQIKQVPEPEIFFYKKQQLNQNWFNQLKLIFQEQVDTNQAFQQLYYQLEQVSDYQDVKQIIMPIFGAKRSVKIAEQVVKIMKKDKKQLEPVDLMCNQLRKKGIQGDILTSVKQLFIEGRKKSLKKKLVQLLGILSTAIWQKYEKFIFEQQKKPLPYTTLHKIDPSSGIQFYRYNEPTITAAEKNTAKVLMVIGQTGAGKTTFLNSLYNYLNGVEIDDPMRYLLIVQDTSNQIKSLTKQISTYYVKNLKNNYVYRLIDTPGFGDTEGHKQDQTLIQKITKKFREEIDVIHCVMFVVKSTNVRLNHYQKYIFQSVLSLFGVDVAKKFCFILTFTDGGSPPVLPSLKNVQDGFGKFWPLLPEPQYIPVNNGAFFQTADLNCSIYSRYWDIGMESMDRLVERVDKAKPVSLTLTKQMINKRDNLANQMRNTREKIQILNTLQSNLQVQITAISSFEKQINQTKGFTFTTKQVQYYHETTDKNVTICNNCKNETCHDDCGYGDGKSKQDCEAFDYKTGNCLICPKKCSWTAHSNGHYIRKTRQVTKINTISDLKERYDKSKKGKSLAEKAMMQMLNEHNDLFDQTKKAYKQMFLLNRELEKISLTNKKSQTFIEYLEIEIKNLKETKQKGFKQKINKLEKSLRDVIFTQQLINGEGQMDPGSVRKSLTTQRLEEVAKAKSSIGEVFESYLGVHSG